MRRVIWTRGQSTARAVNGQVLGYSEQFAFQDNSARGFGDTGYMDFRFGALHCVAIDHAGEAYAWVLRGHVCKEQASANLEEHVKSILGAIRIGPASSTRNALGNTLKPLS